VRAEINFPPLRGLYILPLHSWGTSDALGHGCSRDTNSDADTDTDLTTDMNLDVEANRIDSEAHVPIALIILRVLQMNVKN